MSFKISFMDFNSFSIFMLLCFRLRVSQGKRLQFSQIQTSSVVYSSEFTFKKFCVRIFPSILTHARKIRIQNLLKVDIFLLLT